jgi:hypothetical protein
MAEATSGVKALRALEPRDLEHQVEDIRSNIDDIVDELDKRRHELFDWRLQLRKHARTFGALAAVLVVTMAGTIAFSIWQSRRRSRPLAKAKRWRSAVSRVIDHPEYLVRRDDGLGRKALTAAASAFTGGVAKSAAERLMAPRQTTNGMTNGSA